MQKKNLQSNKVEEIRDTTEQPTVYVDSQGNRTYNKRKITELPGFVVNLTLAIRLEIFAKQIFFNYEFLIGLFNCLSFTEIIELAQRAMKIDYFTTTSASKEVGETMVELGLLTLLFMQCGALMSDYPSSSISQVISRSLNYYNYLPRFTQFFKYYDKYSYVDCSLIVPYQFLASPGSDILFQLDKHRKPIVAAAVGGISEDPFVFTLSDKVFLYNMGTLSDMGEVQLKPTDSDYTMLITYFNEKINPFKTTAIKNISGGFLVANEHNLLSYSYDSTILAHKKFDQDESIRDMFLITSNHVAVGLKKGHTFIIFLRAT